MRHAYAPVPTGDSVSISIPRRAAEKSAFLTVAKALTAVRPPRAAAGALASVVEDSTKPPAAASATPTATAGAKKAASRATGESAWVRDETERVRTRHTEAMESMRAVCIVAVPVLVCVAIAATILVLVLLHVV